MKKSDYHYACGVGKLLNAVEYMLKAIVPNNAKQLITKFDVPYGKTKQQKLDLIYSKTASSKKKPIFFYIHGGGFISGTTSLRRPYCCRMAKAGYFVVNIGYRVAPEKQFPNQFYDILEAIDFVIDRCYEYNLDPNKIVIGGESAGAYLSCYIAEMTKKKELYEQFSIDFRHKNDFDVKAAVLINGAYSAEIARTKSPFVKTFIKSFFDLTNDDLKRDEIIFKKEFCPLLQMDSNFPHTIVVQGKHDIFGTGTKKLLHSLEDNGIKHYLYTTKGLSGLHAFAIAPIFKDAAKSQDFTIQSLDEILSD